MIEDLASNPEPPSDSPAEISVPLKTLPGFLTFLDSDAKRYSFGVFIFFVAGLCEIGGGWLVWQTVREKKGAWLAVLGSLLLVLYGFVAAVQPLMDFARVYAIYGAFFIVMSVLWGVLLDGFRPDTGDILGMAIAIIGAAVMYFWPR